MSRTISRMKNLNFRPMHLLPFIPVLMLIPSVAVATTTGLPGLPVDTSTDLSIKLLNMILGNNWYSWLSGTSSTGPGSALASMLKIYNNLILSVVALLIVYTYGTGIADTAHKGKVLGDKYSTMWTPIRQAGSIAALIPIPGLGGISLIQGLVAWLIMASIGLANAVWDGGVDYMVSNGGGVTPAPKAYFLPSNVLDGMGLMAADTAALQESAAQGGPGLTTSGFTCSVIGTTSHSVYCSMGDFTNSGGTVVRGNLGTITAGCVNKSINGTAVNTCSTIASALESAFSTMYNAVSPVVTGKGATSFSSQLLPTIESVRSTYSSSLASGMSTAYTNISSSATSGLQSFATTAKADGWASAGMFFYELGQYNLAYQKVSNVNETFTAGGGNLVSSVPPSTSAVVTAINTDVNYAPDSLSSLTTAATQASVSGTAQGSKQSVWSAFLPIDNLLGTAVGTTINYILNPPGNGASSAMNPVDPIVQVQNFGDRITTAALGIYTAGIAVGAVAAAADSGSKTVWGEALSFFTASATGSVAGAAKFVAMNMMIPVLMVTAALLLMGFAMAYYVPIAPAILFGFAVVEWLIVVIETIIAAPLWMAAHAMPTGDGLTGDHGRNGYGFMLGLLARPVLTIFGLFLALGMMATVVYFMALTFQVAFASSNGGWHGPVDTIMQIILLVGVMLVTVNKTVEVITRLPSSALRWIGADGGQPAGKQEEALVAGYGRTTNQQTGQAIQQSHQGITNAASAGKNMKEKSAAAESANIPAKSVTQDLADMADKGNV